jgi:cytochrome c oxidase subunit 1/cytochrome c oxidase subunit I+III
MYVDQRFAQVLFDPGPSLATARVSWMSAQPQVYAFAVPVLGVALDSVATATGVRLARRSVAQVAVGAFAVLGIGVFALPAISPEYTDQPVTKFMALAAPIPVLVVLGLVGLTLKAGRPRPSSGVVGGVLALLLLLLATVLGAVTAFPGIIELGSQWGSAVSQLTLVAAVTAGVAGLYHWSTKVLGRPGSEAMGRLAPLVLALGGLVLTVPQAISGIAGEGVEASNGIEAMNGVAVAGGVIVVLGGLLAAVGLVGRRGDDVPADPWEGQTLEWATASPPAFANFDGDLPAVTSAEPLLDQADDEEDED